MSEPVDLRNRRLEMRCRDLRHVILEGDGRDLVHTIERKSAPGVMSIGVLLPEHSVIEMTPDQAMEVLKALALLLQECGKWPTNGGG